MSEGSLPTVGPRFTPRKLLRKALERLSRRRKPQPGADTRTDAVAEAPAESEEQTSLEARAAGAIREHVEANATLFERVERLTERARRMEQESAPGESSASSKADRAREEARDSLLSLRAAFSGSDEELRAFDREAGRLYPALAVSGGQASG